jgi:hypothetical protein
VITDDMLHTVLRRRASGESVEDIQPDLIIPVGKRKGGNPSVASIYRALAEHAKREVYPEAIEQAHTDFATLDTTTGRIPAGQAISARNFPSTTATPKGSSKRSFVGKRPSEASRQAGTSPRHIRTFAAVQGHPESRKCSTSPTHAAGQRCRRVFRLFANEGRRGKQRRNCDVNQCVDIRTVHSPLLSLKNHIDSSFTPK